MNRGGELFFMFDELFSIETFLITESSTNVHLYQVLNTGIKFAFVNFLVFSFDSFDNL